MTDRPKAQHELFKGTKDLADAAIGDHIGTIEFTVTDEMVWTNAWANDDYNPWYLEDSPFGGRIVSPAHLASFDIQVFYGHYAYPAGGSLYAGERLEYLGPVRVGVPYRMTGRIVDIYRRKGRTFFVAGIDVVDEAGTTLVRITKTVAAPVRPEPAG